jgi:hypothetical protein
MGDSGDSRAHAGIPEIADVRAARLADDGRFQALARARSPRRRNVSAAKPLTTAAPRHASPSVEKADSNPAERAARNVMVIPLRSCPT